MKNSLKAILYQYLRYLPRKFSFNLNFQTVITKCFLENIYKLLQISLRKFSVYIIA